MAEESVFWAEKVVEEITKQKRKEYVCEGGWTPSGYFHIGNSRPEIFTPYAVYLKLKDVGFKAKQVLVVDDFDPVHKIPGGISVPEKEKENVIGVPYKLAPSPFEGAKSWADYFTSQVTDVIDDFGVDVKFISSFESYKSGERNDLIKFSLDNASKIVEMWNKIAGADKPADFLPITVLCEKCNKIMFTEAFAWDGKQVSYKCKACKREGKVSPLNGRAKLHYRVHWVANWIVNNVAFESGGKDHFSKGSSVDVATALIRDVFKKQAPYTTPTEFVQLKGAKMSGSVGNVFGLKEWLEVASPELFRFLFFSYKPNSTIDFSLADNSFILLNERFERAERVYYGKDKAENERIEKKLKNAYVMSVIGKASKKEPLQVPYSFSAQIVQLLDLEKGFEKITALLKQTGHLEEKISSADKKKLLKQFNRAKTWVEKYAPEEVKLSFLENLSDKEKSAMDEAARKLLPMVGERSVKLKSADDIQQVIFETAKSNNVPPKQLFKAVYLALTGKESGPRAGLLILALGKERCIERLKEAAI